MRMLMVLKQQHIKFQEEKNKNPGFTSMLSLMKITFSSSQIEGRCFRNNSETKQAEQTVIPSKGLNSRFGTQEELPYICRPIEGQIRNGMKLFL